MFIPLLVTILNIINLAKGFPSQLPEKETNTVSTYDFPFVSRSEWNAREPKECKPLPKPVPYVVIHHSYDFSEDITREKCKRAMVAIQDLHMDKMDFDDIGYQFLVCNDGTAFEGRGWRLGSHARHFNTISVGICLIGDWRYELPPADMLKTTQGIIEAGIELGYIKPDYKLIGHRQVRNTECPGEALFQEIQKWDHYSSYPASYRDLRNMEELPRYVKDIIIGNATHIS